MRNLQANGGRGKKCRVCCQVCSVALVSGSCKEYCLKHRACSSCLGADAVVLPDHAEQHRFCHQCARSCRDRLSKRQIPRSRSLATSSADTPVYSSSDDDQAATAAAASDVSMPAACAATAAAATGAASDTAAAARTDYVDTNHSDSATCSPSAAAAAAAGAAAVHGAASCDAAFGGLAGAPSLNLSPYSSGLSMHCSYQESPHASLLMHELSLPSSYTAAAAGGTPQSMKDPGGSTPLVPQVLQRQQQRQLQQQQEVAGGLLHGQQGPCYGRSAAAAAAAGGAGVGAVPEVMPGEPMADGDFEEFLHVMMQEEMAKCFAEQQQQQGSVPQNQQHYSQQQQVWPAPRQLLQAASPFGPAATAPAVVAPAGFHMGGTALPSPGAAGGLPLRTCSIASALPQMPSLAAAGAGARVGPVLTRSASCCNWQSLSTHSAGAAQCATFNSNFNSNSNTTCTAADATTWTAAGDHEAAVAAAHAAAARTAVRRQQLLQQAKQLLDEEQMLWEASSAAAAAAAPAASVISLQEQGRSMGSGYSSVVFEGCSAAYAPSNAGLETTTSFFPVPAAGLQLQQQWGVQSLPPMQLQGTLAAGGVGRDVAAVQAEVAKLRAQLLHAGTELNRLKASVFGSDVEGRHGSAWQA